MLAKGPGTQARLGVVHRGSVAVATINLALVADPSLQVVDLGAAMTPQQRQFREGWLGGN
jgi:hypothetical protein